MVPVDIFPQFALSTISERFSEITQSDESHLGEAIWPSKSLTLQGVRGLTGRSDARIPSAISPSRSPPVMTNGGRQRGRAS
jgi:hypothetical protein